MMSRNPSWLVTWSGRLVVALALVLGVPEGGRAQDAAKPRLTEAQKRQTLDHYEKATRLYNVGKFPDAIAEYQAAYLISADPVMLYNIAQCHRFNRQPEEAARFYRNFLRNAPETTRRAEVEKRIEEMERAVEQARLGAPAPAPPPIGQPDPAPAPAPADSPSPSGPVAQAPPPLTPPLVTSPAPPPTTPEALVQQSLPAEPEARPGRFLPLSLMIGGGTLVVTSLVFAAVAGSKAKQVEEKASTRNSRFDESVRNLEKTGKAASALAVLTGLVGLAAGGTGTYLWFSRSGSSSSSATVFPLTAPGLAGAAVHVRF